MRANRVERSRSAKARSSSPTRASVLDRELLTEDETSILLKDLHVSTTNPRSFPYSVKQQCWEKAEKIKGRDPDRWRRDALGNIVYRKLVGCPGCLCHDYDHILPYSKGGKSTLENCQVLQVVIWIFLNYQPMAMFAVDKTLGVVESNDQFPAEITYYKVDFKTGKWGN